MLLAKCAPHAPPTRSQSQSCCLAHTPVHFDCAHARMRPRAHAARTRQTAATRRMRMHLRMQSHGCIYDAHTPLATCPRAHAVMRPPRAHAHFTRQSTWTLRVRVHARSCFLPNAPARPRAHVLIMRTCAHAPARPRAHAPMRPCAHVLMRSRAHALALPLALACAGLPACQPARLRSQSLLPCPAHPLAPPARLRSQ
jgi:hypothetical protein